MGRYIFVLREGGTIEADDAKINGNFIEYITRHSHQRGAINADQVSEVKKRNLGSEGGMRFTGEHDMSFDSTPGSI